MYGAFTRILSLNRYNILQFAVPKELYQMLIYMVLQMYCKQLCKKSDGLWIYDTHFRFIAQIKDFQVWILWQQLIIPLYKSYQSI